MKYPMVGIKLPKRKVAPFAGAWIEITMIGGRKMENNVAPFAGAWIEIIDFPRNHSGLASSLPSRERGLKSAPFLMFTPCGRRSLRGSVD